MQFSFFLTSNPCFHCAFKLEVCRKVPIYDYILFYIGFSMNDSINPINVRQVLIGLMLLLFGTLFYLFGRNPDSVYFIYSNEWLYNLHLNNTFFIVVLNKCISPSFIHSCSFSILTCAFFPTVSKKKYVVACSIWALIGVLFEFGQLIKPNVTDVSFTASWLNKLVYLTVNYLKFGTFDILDVINSILGSTTAYIILIFTQKGLCHAKICKKLIK